MSIKSKNIGTIGIDNKIINIHTINPTYTANKDLKYFNINLILITFSN
jgi:hypothetical protein